jgi:hypothetical protein
MPWNKLNRLAILISKRIFHTIFFVVDVFMAKFFQRASSKAHTHLLSSFYLTGGFIHLMASKILGIPKISIPNNGILSKFSEKELKIAGKHLKKEGYVILEGALSEVYCNQILIESEKIPGKTRLMDGGKGKVESMYFNRSNPVSVRFDYDGSDLISNTLLQELVFDESILKFAQEYLGSEPILDLVAMWWHTSFSSSPDKEAAQWFHFDMDRLKWIKFFFYITDVDANTGPHTFIAGSHRRLGIPYRLRSKGYTRLTDDEVAASFEPEKYKEFTGKRGTLIVEDTRGLHKGKHCISGDRLLFQLEFTTSAFGMPLPEFKINPPAGQHSLAVSNTKKYPRVFQSVK